MGGITEATGTITLTGADDTETVDITLFPETGMGTIYTLLISIDSITSAGTAPTTYDYEVWDRTYVGTLEEDGTNTIAKDDTIAPSDNKIVNKSTSSFGKRVVVNQTAVALDTTTYNAILIGGLVNHDTLTER